MENKNFEYKGWKANGFVALFVILAIIACSIWLIAKGAIIDSMPWTPVMIVAGALVFTIALIACKGFLLLEPNEARVLTFFGKYCGSF